MLDKRYKLYTVGYDGGYSDPFRHTCDIVDDMEEADIVLFTGGSDVDPSLYGCKEHPATYSHIERDIYEMSEYHRSLKLPNVKLRYGTCRGLQLLGVLNGSILIQDVTHHAGSSHYMVNKDGEGYPITSLHHQMVYPFDMKPEDYEILYWSETKRSSHYLGDKVDPKKVVVEPEVIWFPKTKSLGVQGHPEMMHYESITVIMLNKLLINLINV